MLVMDAMIEDIYLLLDYFLNITPKNNFLGQLELKLSEVMNVTQRWWLIFYFALYVLMNSIQSRKRGLLNRLPSYPSQSSSS